jgi:hypothetical protein
LTNIKEYLFADVVVEKRNVEVRVCAGDYGHMSCWVVTERQSDEFTCIHEQPSNDHDVILAHAQATLRLRAENAPIPGRELASSVREGLVVESVEPSQLPVLLGGFPTPHSFGVCRVKIPGGEVVGVAKVKI